MPTDWHKLARAARFKIDGDGMIVELAASRTHHVKVYEQGDHLRLRGVVATPSRIGDLVQETAAHGSTIAGTRSSVFASTIEIGSSVSASCHSTVSMPKSSRSAFAPWLRNAIATSTC